MSEPAARRWVVIFAVALILGCAGALLSIRAFTSAAGIEPRRNGLSVAQRLVRFAEPPGQSADPDRAFRIIYLGDSTLTRFESESSIPTMLQRALERHYGSDLSVVVHDFSADGMSPFEFYFLADEIADARPDLILWQTSFTHLSERRRAKTTRRGLAGFTRPSRFPELLRLPMSDIRLTTDQLLLYRGILATIGLEGWIDVRDEQSKVAWLLPTLNSWIETKWGQAAREKFSKAVERHLFREGYRLRGGLYRYRRELELAHYEDAITGLSSHHVTLRFLRAGLHQFRKRGVPVFVYLNPINVDNLRHEGIYRPRVMKQSAATFRAEVEAEGASFADFHNRFPDSHFNDAPGHFHVEGPIDAPHRLLQLLSPKIIRQIDQIRAR